MPSRSRRPRYGLLLAGLAAALVVAWAGGARAQDTGWEIERFDVAIDVHPDGTLLVTETIDVDFGGLAKHGIFRVIPVRYDVTAAARGRPEGVPPGALWREIDIDDITVSSTAPADIELTRPGPTGGTDLTIRVGDPDVTISGQQRYEVRYRVTGALDEAPDGRIELNWDATGDGWPVPIRAARATIRGVPVEQAACFVGAFGSAQPCAELRVGAELSARAEALYPGEGLTVLATLPAGSADVPSPSYVERWSLGRALTGHVLAWPLAALVAVVGLAGVGALAYREGRDRVTRGGARVDATADGVATHRLALFAPRAVPVEFRPPDELRPAQLGLLIDESVDPVDISATVVDLAVRGHLVIEQIETKRFVFTSTDWRLRATGADRDGLLDYERQLLEGLFEDGDEVLVSDLAGPFAERYRAVQRAIYADGQRQRWFGSRPDLVRTRWLVGGIGLTIAAIAATVGLAMFTTVAVAGIALVVVALTLAVAHRWMPHRTVRGSELLRRTLGFREFIRTAEAERLAFAEEEHLFVRYLPYAVAFGAVERWAERFAALGRPLPDTSHFYVGHGVFDAARFSSGMTQFSHQVGTSLATVPSSSSGSGFSSGGGFSGGGAGGGGGGSW